MTSDIEHILDRRGLRKKLSFWRIATIIIFAVLLLALLKSAGAFSGLSSSRAHIARIPISGVITEDRKLLKLIKQAQDDDSVKGVVLVINSPGGTTVGGEAIFHAVRNLAKAKPTATSVGTLAASAGYMIATASDHIVARHSSIVGSIGVIFQYPQAGELLDKLGVQLKEVKSSPLKAEPSPFHTPPPEAIQVIQNLIDDSYAWFVDLVTERRPLNRQQVLKVADGSVYSGNQGLKLKLIDALGGEEKAKEWLVKEKGLNESLELIDWNIPKDRSSFPFLSLVNTWILGNGLNSSESFESKSLQKIIPRRLFLDGLLSVWHG